MSLDKFLAEKKSLSGFNVEKDPDIIGLDLNIMKQDYEKGVQIAEPCQIEHMKDKFAWMRGDQNCWTGFPNDGKTEFSLFMAVVKSLKDRWKWAMWSPEMKGANFVDGKVKTHYNFLAYNIMATISGKTPYKHIYEKYNKRIPLMTIDEIQELKEWIEKHFIFLDPKEKKVEDIEVMLHRIYENQGYDGVFIDPFKNVEANLGMRDDQHLNNVFARMKENAVSKNISMNWIAHPRSGINRIANKQGQDVLLPCTQYHLSGGAAWDNGMDGIYSIHRPYTLDNLNDPRVVFHNLKQKKQDLVCERGEVHDIEFNIKTRRYLFNGVDIFTNQVVHPKLEKFPTNGNADEFDIKTGEVFNMDKANKILDESEAPF